MNSCIWAASGPSVAEYDSGELVRPSSFVPSHVTRCDGAAGPRRPRTREQERTGTESKWILGQFWTCWGVVRTRPHSPFRGVARPGPVVRVRPILPLVAKGASSIDLHPGPVPGPSSPSSAVPGRGARRAAHAAARGAWGVWREWRESRARWSAGRTEIEGVRGGSGRSVSVSSSVPPLFCVEGRDKSV